MEEKKIYCTICTQQLPPGQNHPEFFLQSSLTPDPTDVFNLHEELDYVLGYLRTLSNTLLEFASDSMERQRAYAAIHFPDQPALQVQDNLMFGLYEMLLSHTEEARRRAMRLRNAGLYWKQEDRNDDSLFPDLPPPHTQPAGDQQRKEG